MSLSRTQLLLNLNSDALLAMQQGDFTGALRTLQGCIRQLQRFHLPQEDNPVAAPVLGAADPIPVLIARDDHEEVTEPTGNSGANQGGGVTGAATEEDDDDDFPEENDDFSEEEEDEDEEMYQDARAISVYNIPINIHGETQDDLGAHVVTDTSVDSQLLTRQTFQVFEEAIATTSLDCADGEFHLPFLHAILLYNMGLCLHLIAKTQRANRLFVPGNSAARQQQQHPRHPLSRAALLYNLALRTIQGIAQEGIDDEGNYNPAETRPVEQDMVLLLLAIRNNLCHIKATFLGDLPVAWECVQHMRALLTHMYNRNLAGQRLPLLLDGSTPYSDFFSINIFFFLSSQSQAPNTSGAA